MKVIFFQLFWIVHDHNVLRYDIQKSFERSNFKNGKFSRVSTRKRKEREREREKINFLLHCVRQALLNPNFILVPKTLKWLGLCFHFHI